MQLGYDSGRRDAPAPRVERDAKGLHLVIPANRRANLWADPDRWRLLSLVFVGPMVAWMVPALRVMPCFGAIFIAFMGFLVVWEVWSLWARAGSGPGAVVLTWRDGVFRLPGGGVQGDALPVTADVITWSKRAGPTLRVQPIWPASLSDTGVLHVDSKIDYSTPIAAFTLAPLLAAVAEFEAAIRASQVHECET